jgi:hypothetical protein
MFLDLMILFFGPAIVGGLLGWYLSTRPQKAAPPRVEPPPLSTKPISIPERDHLGRKEPSFEIHYR